MDITKSKESIRDDEECRELNPLQEIFHADSSSKQNDATEASDNKKYEEYNDVTEPSDHKKYGEYRDKEDHFAAKRQRNSDYHAMMEKKRRKNIKDKIDILQAMTPNSIKSDFGGKLEDIIEYMRSLKHQQDVMSMIYMPSFYGTQSPYMTPCGYYASGMPMYPQNMSYIPQFNQGEQVVESAKNEITDSKRPQNNESCDETKKRKRTDFKQKIETLEQMLGCTEQEDIVLRLGTIVDKIRESKNFVESYYRSMGSMGMELPPWQSPYDTPNSMMFAQGESSCNDNSEENNNPETSNPM